MAEGTSKQREDAYLDDLTNKFVREFRSKKSENTGASEKPAPSLVIPRFYKAPPSESDNLKQQLRSEARSAFLQARSQELMSNEELNELLGLLEANATPPAPKNDNERKMIGYKDFLKVKQLTKTKLPKATTYFSPTLFARLQCHDSYGRVPVKSVFMYCMRRTWLDRSRLGLSLYDVNGLGYLTERDLELYINDLIPTLPQLAKLDPTFHYFYVCTAVRRFMFFLDTKRQGRVRITDVLASGFLDDLLELRDSPESQATETVPDSTREQSDTARSSSSSENWFSADSLLRVYGQYLNLDKDRNGMLNIDEIKEYGGGTLTDVFMERLFQECVTYKKTEPPFEAEMDYKSYLDFVLAMENKKDRASIEYFFRVLDIRQLGYLDGFAFNHFFRAIYDNLVATAQCDDDIVDFLDVKDEIFDMVTPKDPDKITLDDLIKSKQADTVINILSDHDGFWRYDHREVLATEDEDEEEEDDSRKDDEMDV